MTSRRFTGAIEGVGRADHIPAFILTARGYNHSSDRVSGTWTVQPGSGTTGSRSRRSRPSGSAEKRGDHR